MSAHTPGPWKAECRSTAYKGGEWPEDEFLQWEVDGPREPDGRGQYFQADARLISAAPDLLEALKECLGDSEEVCERMAMEYGKYRQEMQLAQRQRIAKARAAIAKAEGKQ